ncbi:hypothetical protein HSX11_26260 [Oxalobacteraceae bacterium]|nr:hypothetical protein [Oxalobacteraceae bacterium]
MSKTLNPHLLAGAALSGLAAVFHLACIFFGASWYRAMGAGEEMATLADSGSSTPTLITLFIAAILMLWSLYALSGAGAIPKLPFLRPVLCAITVVYLVRGFAFVPLMVLMPGRSATFWLASSAICAGFGVVHLIGLRKAWASLAE